MVLLYLQPLRGGGLYRYQRNPRATRTRSLDYRKRVVSYGRDSHKEICLITLILSLKATEYSIYLKVPVIIDGKKTVVIIDSRVTRNFAFSSFIRL